MFMVLPQFYQLKRCTVVLRTFGVDIILKLDGLSPSFQTTVRYIRSRVLMVVIVF